MLHGYLHHIRSFKFRVRNTEFIFVFILSDYAWNWGLFLQGGSFAQECLPFLLLIIFLVRFLYVGSLEDA